MAINKTTQYTTDPNTIPVTTSTGTDQELSSALNDRNNTVDSYRFVNDLAGLKALTGMSQDQKASIATGVRAGYFVFDSTNISASVTSGTHDDDPQQGVYVLPDSDTTGASGAWVRVTRGRLLAGWFGASTSVANNSVPVQGAIDYSTSIGFIPVEIDSGTFTFTGQINLSGTNPTVNPDPVPFVPIIGKGNYNTVLDFSGHTGESHILIERGSGSINKVEFGLFTIKGRSGTGGDPDHGLEIAGKGGVTPKGIRFQDMRYGCQMHNKNTGEFTELCVLTDCIFDRSCDGVLRYRVTSGNESFHGSGLWICEINTDGVIPIVTINDGALVYNAPLDCRVWTHGNATLISNTNTSQRRAAYTWGHINHESFTSTTLTLGDATSVPVSAYHAGSYHAFGGLVDRNDFYFVEFASLNSDGSVNAIFLPHSFQVAMTTGGNTLPTRVALGSDSGGTEWSLMLRGSNYEFMYVLHTTRNSSGGTPYNVVSTLEEFNVAGYGAPTFSVDSNGYLVVTNNNFPASGVTAYVTARSIGQRPSSHP